MNCSLEVNEVAAALVKAQAMIEPAKKNAVNPHFNKTYADLVSLWDVITPALQANGLAIIQLGVPSALPNTIALETIAVHSSGQWISGEMTLPMVRTDPQAAGSAVTYARRYGLAALLGIVADADDDGNGATPPRTPVVTQQTAPVAQQTAPQSLAELDAQGAPAPQPVDNVAKTLSDMITTKQLGMIRAVANENNYDAEAECVAVMGCKVSELHRKAASAFIDHLLAAAEHKTPLAPPTAPAMTGEPAGRPQAATPKEGATQKPNSGGTGNGKFPAITQPQLGLLAKVAERNQVAITTMIEQEFTDVSTPEELSKWAASYLIDTYN